MPTKMKSKPVIEDLISEYLDGDMRKNALDFVAWLRANKLNPVCSGGKTFKTGYKGDVICTVKLFQPWVASTNMWAVNLYLHHADKYKETIESEGLQNIFFDDIIYCVHDSGGAGTGCDPKKPCAGGENRTILGKVIAGI